MREAALQTQRSVEKRGGGVLGIRAEIPLQPVVQTMTRYLCPKVEDYPATTHAKSHSRAGRCPNKAVTPWKGAQAGAGM